jgi:hypothetical protein
MGRILEGERTTRSTLARRNPCSSLTVILAFAVGFAVGMYHWRRDQNGLQRWYFTSYVRSAMPESENLWGKGPSQYQVIDLVDDRRPDQTLTTVTDEDAEVTGGNDGKLSLKYTEKWARREHLRAIIRTIVVDDDIMHSWLQEKVYDLRSISDLLRWPMGSGVLAAGVVLLAGLLFAFPADLRRAARRLMSSSSGQQRS